jgi:hypothetical protein
MSLNENPIPHDLTDAAQAADAKQEESSLVHTAPAGISAEADRVPGEVPDSPTLRVVQSFLDRHGLEILFDGSLRRGGGLTMASSRDELDEWLATRRFDATQLLDRILLQAQVEGTKLRLNDVKLALRTLTHEAAEARRAYIVKKLLGKALTESDRAEADVQWERLVSNVFETPAPLGRAILEHFIWQVQRKLTDQPVEHHLMPIVFSPVQGSGKTTFVKRFLAPLEELVPRSVLLSDLADKRSGEIFRYPALLVDDMEQIDRRLVPVLKNLLTSEGMSRRLLRTSLSVAVQQRATLIGTANEEIGELVADDTGHRRFATLRFRNGQIDKGGDPLVWETITATDMLLLWRSVDPFAPSPLMPNLAALFALQEADRPVDEVALWLAELDLDSAGVLMISTPKGVRAAQLHKLFQKQTDSQLWLTRFGRAMKQHAADPQLPFGPRIETGAGIVYPRKPA